VGADPAVADRMEVASFEGRIYPEVALRGGTRSPLPETVPPFLLPELLGIYADGIPALSRKLGRDLTSLWLARYS